MTTPTTTTGPTKKTLLSASLALLLAACQKPDGNRTVQQELDQCMRWQLFERCMASLPAGPSSAKYNDWDEVVSECEYVATRAAYRDPRFVQPQCYGNNAPEPVETP